ncbi:uncharacterized protein LOC128160823 [Crassostrea angulata]|uniref:uncharacterized protein LOC128160823 n=1 Tax=Magallana angulata TaxID=2784310 RepID=UPI0022B17DBA|nr:uncharacterized protein LOC128160823 [Crassostrea angulata]
MALFQALLIVIIQNVELKSIFSELGYIPVPSCPKSPREWNDSSLRLNCNETNKYHCAPYLSETSQLYEFCYRSLSISKGNCLGIRDDGNLNAYKCEKFVSGCPDDDYSSSEIHKSTSQLCQKFYNSGITPEFNLVCEEALMSLKLQWFEEKNCIWHKSKTYII